MSYILHMKGPSGPVITERFRSRLAAERVGKEACRARACSYIDTFKTDNQTRYVGMSGGIRIYTAIIVPENDDMRDYWDMLEHQLLSGLTQVASK